jgi:cytidine deaminase
VTDEDEKLLTLARAARGRIHATQGAAVRDETGRSYAGATVTLRTLHVAALDLAVAQAVASGSRGLEAVVIVGGDLPDVAPVRELGGQGIPVWHCDAAGRVLAEVRS